MSLSYFIDEWASSLNIFQLPAGVPVEITWFPGSPPEAWVQLWMNQLNGADDITDTVTITNNVTNSGTYMWTPPTQFASTNDTYDYQLGVAGYEDDPGLAKGSRLFYIVPAGSLSTSSSATPTPTASSSSTTPSPTAISTQSSAFNSSPAATPTKSSSSTTPSPGSSTTQSALPTVVIHNGVSPGAAAGIGVGVMIAVLIIPAIEIFGF
ncbi:hypothetical protein L207DRAFT_511124 [Hyaloscypha variabilis F]|uniref:Yeast cell wall synthesis Kre9/Knh1-like N-terminal domain-containing protein n=1 Tax=Hyaloscypha variabilis (strain UAMH 11265 / GT02V1 / F) TaxID=1149755 RepID=A0A2J6RRQ3_HYAVF|nr:hypothetical protein L207DRAFT_511124 [Hyaloscypha variabilis F]